MTSLNAQHIESLKQMGYSIRRSHRMPLLSAKNRKQRLQFTQAHQNWTIENWKSIAWSDESRFLLWHSDGRARIWCKEHEGMDPSCLVSTVQAGGGLMVWGILSWHTLLSTNWASFKCHRLPEYCCWPYPSLYDYSVDWSQTGFLNMTMSSLYSNGPPQCPDLNPKHIWNVVEREIHFMDVQLTNLQQLRDSIMSIWTKMFPKPCWIYSTKN